MPELNIELSDVIDDQPLIFMFETQSHDGDQTKIQVCRWVCDESPTLCCHPNMNWCNTEIILMA